MKKLSLVKDRLLNLRDVVKSKYKADIVGIFGSVSRGEETEDSDVDVLVKFHERATLFDMVGLSLFLEENLGMRVDVVPYDAVREELKEEIFREVVKL